MINMVISILILIYFIHVNGFHNPLSIKKPCRSLSLLFTTTPPNTSGGYNIDHGVSNESYILPLKDELKVLLNQLLYVEMQDRGKSSMMASTMFLENDYLFAKSDLYETVMDELIQMASNDDEISALCRVDTLLKGFVNNERKRRAKLKLDYLLAGASTGKLEEAVLLLSETDEIDQDLFTFIDGMIKKEVMTKLGPTADEEDIKDIEGIGKNAIDVLQMLKRRLDAETKGEINEFVKLLATMINESDAAQRDKLLRRSLRRVEEIEDFEQFVDEAVQHLTSTTIPNSSDGNYHDSQSDRSEVSTLRGGAVVEVIKDIKFSTQEMKKMLKTGLSDNQDIYSTSADDYMDKFLVKDGENTIDDSGEGTVSNDNNNINENSGL